MHKALDFFLNNRWLVLGLLIALVTGGTIVMLQLPIEAYPDLTNNQVVVTVNCPGMSPVEVEQLVTYPIEISMMGLPKMQMVRSTSKLELSMLTIIFDDSVNPYLARQLVSERIAQAQAGLPPGLQPQLGPMATAFGEVYQYTVQAPKMTLMQIKTLHDWTIRYALMRIEGISEINSWGGETKEYTIEVDPGSLRRYGLTLHDVLTRIQANNSNFGGNYIEHSEQEYQVRGIGRAENIDELGQIVLASNQGTPVLLRDVAVIGTRPMLRHGAVNVDAKGETVSGMVIILRGENGQRIISEVKKAVEALKLPNGAKIVPFYDQSMVIDGTIHTVKKNLIEAAVLVAVILLIFLADWRAALVVACVIPLSLLFAFLGMDAFGVTLNLMSLGAIDFGTIVDGSVVMVENCIRHLESNPGEGKLIDVVRDSAHEVARPIIFGVLIIISVYIPVLTLQSLEGRMFRPMALTVVSALTGSLLLALFVVPTLCTVALKHRAKEAEHEEKKKKADWFGRLRGRYERSLDVAMKRRPLVLGGAIVLVLAALVSLKFIGTEFMPTLDEGSIVITSRRLPGISLTESLKIGHQINTVIKSFPEVTHLVVKLGRPDLATEAMGVYESDAYLTLLPRNKWPCHCTKQQLSDRIERELRKIPGVDYEFTQPMEMRMDETITGTRGAVALKIFGPDLTTLEQLGHQALAILTAVNGSSETQMERITGASELEIRVNRPALARYGLDVADVQELVEHLIGSRAISEMVEGEERFPIAVRLPQNIRNDPEALAGLMLRAPAGELVRLDQVADLRMTTGPILINREEAQRRVVVMSNVSGRDLGGFVEDAQKQMARKLKLPQGYRLEWGGQYENQVRAEQRLAIVLPVSLLIISGLLYATFQNVKQTLLILMIVPLALVGGVAALWIRGIHLNLSASVGFIALFGIAVLNGVVMVSHINSLREGGMDTAEAVRQGASDRLRPVLITALVASLGFIPMAVATSIGAEVQRPLATVVIGGLMTATLLTLYVLPVLYGWFSPRMARKES